MCKHHEKTYYSIYKYKIKKNAIINDQSVTSKLSYIKNIFESIYMPLFLHRKFCIFNITIYAIKQCKKKIRKSGAKNIYRSADNKVRLENLMAP